MTTFGIETDNNQAVYKFIEETNERLQVENFVKNPFKGKIVLVEQEETIKAGIHIEPIYPNPFYLGAVATLGLILLKGFTLWSLIPLTLVLIGFLHTNIFFYIMMKQGLKKAGYKGKTKFITSDKVVELYMYGATRSI